MRTPLSSASMKPSITSFSGVACPLPATVRHMVLNDTFPINFLPKALDCFGIHSSAYGSDCGVSLFLLNP